MDQAKEAIKELGKKIKRHYKRVFKLIIILIFIFILILPGAVYYITVDDGTYKEDDWSSTPYGASQYKNGITVDAEGNLKNGMTAQELWDKMLENKSRVDEYLDSPEELGRLMRAEIVTKYPDTRPNPDEEIDWDELIKNPDIMQGIIKFKRAESNGNKTTMRYVSPSTFQGYIDTYNKTGSEEAKQSALHSFTLKKASSGTTNNNPDAVAAGDGVMTDISQIIIDATNPNRTAWPGAQLCAKWVDDVYDTAGVGACRHISAYESFKHHGISTDMSAIPIGAAVYGTGSGSTGHWGHIGIYIGSGQVIDSQNGGIKTSSMEDWLSWQVDVIDGKQRMAWLGMGRQ